MGIKEFLQQTVENERDNIRDIKIEAGKKRKELPFDPETEITEPDWQGMKELLESFRERPDWNNFPTLAARMKLLFPERANQLNLDDFVWRGLVKRLKNFQVARAWDIFLQHAAEMKRLYPDRADALIVDENIWQKIKKELEAEHVSWHVSWWKFLKQINDIKILWPNRIKEINIEQFRWQVVKEEIESLGHKGEFSAYLTDATRMRILCPEQLGPSFFKNIPWRELKKSLAISRKEEDWYVFSYKAEAMMILAAHKVEVTDEGLKITMRPPKEEYREEREPRPVRLSFRPKRTE